MDKQKIITRQISERLERLREASSLFNGITSWSKYLREGLGMSLTQLASRVGIAQSTMSESEKQEIEGKLTVNKLRKIADALNCDFVYGFIPRDSIEATIHKQAETKALKYMAAAETQMEMEDQKVKRSADERLEELIEEKKSSKYLWK